MIFGVFRWKMEDGRLRWMMELIIDYCLLIIFLNMIIMVGGLNYFTLPQSTAVREKIKRLAFAAAHLRMETLLALDYIATGQAGDAQKTIRATLTNLKISNWEEL